MLVVALLAATAVAFVFSEQKKLEDSPIYSASTDALFSPVCTACRPDAREAEIRFRLRTEEDVQVDIVDRDGAPVREKLVSARYRPGALRFSWDGRDERGRVVPDGSYRVRVALSSFDRALEFPGEIQVDSTPPVIEEIDVQPRAISPDGDRRSDRAAVSYRFGEPAYAVLYVDGKRLPGRSFRRRPIGVLQWYARGVRRGPHRLALAAQDPAGNLSPSTREFTVRVRYVELARTRYRARPGALLRVRVSTDATTLRYTLGPSNGIVRAERGIRRFAVRAPALPGRYLLTVRVGQHRAQAIVVVARGRS